jgi:hypothetical protein
VRFEVVLRICFCILETSCANGNVKWIVNVAVVIPWQRFVGRSCFVDDRRVTRSDRD